MSNTAISPDSVDGFDRAPDRYSRQARETIDRIRDEAHAWAEHPDLCNNVSRANPQALADLLFAFWCHGNALKYADRRGAKGDAESDANKEHFYRMMAQHVLQGQVPSMRDSPGRTPDPRSERPGFKPYVRQS